MNLRKVSTLMLVFALILSFCAPAHAAQLDSDYDSCAYASTPEDITTPNPKNEENVAESRHICDYSDEPTVTYVVGKAINPSATQCKKYCKDTYHCTISGCDGTTVRYRYDENPTNHTVVLYDSTCNGTTQTLYYKCKYCNYKKGNGSRLCPGGPHSGGCSYLPA